MPRQRDNGSPDELLIVGESATIYRVTGLTDDERSLIGQHYNAIDRALKTGQADDYVNGQGHIVRGLDYFQGHQVQGVRLATDQYELWELQMFGELSEGPYENP